MRIARFALCLALALMTSSFAHADTRNDHDVKWIKRCDRMKAKERFECLEKMRAEVATRYVKDSGDRRQKAPAANATPRSSSDKNASK